MPPQPPKKPDRQPPPASRPAVPGRPAAAAPAPGRPVMAPVPPIMPAPNASGDVSLGVAVAAGEGGGTVTARKAGGLRDMGLEVDPDVIGVRGALQHLAKAINIAFQTDYGENYLESVYQAAVLRRGEVHVIHREYFGLRETWFGQFGMLLRSLQLTFDGPDPASPEGQKRIAEKGPASLRGLLNLVGRKLDLVPEFEDRVPAYVEQMLDRLEASGIIVGWGPRRLGDLHDHGRPERPDHPAGQVGPDFVRCLEVPEMPSDANFVEKNLPMQRRRVDMAVELAQVRKDALALPSAERVALAEELLASLDRDDPRLDALWAGEAEGRIAAFEAGTMEAIPEAEVFAEFEAP